MDSFSGSDFLYEPIFLHGISGLLHLLLLLAVIATFLYKKLRANDSVSDEGFKGRFLWQKQTLTCCLAISIINLCLCLVGCFHGLSKDVGFLVASLNLVLRTLSWGSLYAYLRAYFFTSDAKGFPLLLRIWWGLYLSVSCYSLGVDIVFYHTHISFSDIQYLAPDIVSVLNGSFLCYVGFTKRVSSMDDDLFLEQPLLGSDSSSIPSYAKANFFSRLCFAGFGDRFKHIWKVIRKQGMGFTGDGVSAVDRSQGDEKTIKNGQIREVHGPPVLTGITDSPC